MKRLLKILAWMGIAAWFVVAMGFVSGRSEEVLCNRIEVVLKDSVNNLFLTRGEIRRMVESSQVRLQGYPISQINTRELEQLLEQNHFIKNAEVCVDVSGRLQVKVEQREPLVRVLPEGRRGYYLDSEGKVLQLSGRYAPMVMIVSGRIPDPENGYQPGKKLEEIYNFCKYLAEHKLWSQQVVQIYVNHQGEYELIPRVGAHQILMGSLDEWERKLRNLELLYAQGLPKYGWNTYKTINLEFTNQVICTKR